MPANFYHYEPLLNYDIIQIRGAPNASTALRNLRQLLSCNYTNMDDYLKYGQTHNFLFNHNTRLWQYCRLYPQLCWNPQFLASFCQLFPLQSMKIVRLRIALAKPILQDPQLTNVRFVLLIRDPRGTCNPASTAIGVQDTRIATIRPYCVATWKLTITRLERFFAIILIG